MKPLRPYVIEFFILLATVLIFVLAFVFGNVITVNRTLAFILLVWVPGLFGIWHFSRTFNVGARALTDLVLRKTLVIDGTFVSRESAFMSVLMNQLTKENVRPGVSREVFKYVIKSRGRFFVLHSPDFLELKEGADYVFTVGKRSKVILTCEKKHSHKEAPLAEAKTVKRGKTTYYSLEAGLERIDRAEKEGERILGIDSFELTENETRPLSEHGADFSSPHYRPRAGETSVYDAARAFLREKSALGVRFFEIVC